MPFGGPTSSSSAGQQAEGTGKEMTQAEGPASALRGFSGCCWCYRLQAAFKVGGPALGLVSVGKGDESSFPGCVPESLEPELEPEHSFLAAASEAPQCCGVAQPAVSYSEHFWALACPLPPLTPFHDDQQAFTYQSWEWQVGTPGGRLWRTL